MVAMVPDVTPETLGEGEGREMVSHLLRKGEENVTHTHTEFSSMCLLVA